MQKIRCWLNRWYPILIESSIVLFCAFFISFSDVFQEKISPEKFWSCKVKALEGDLKKDKWKVRDLELSIQKEKAIGQYTVQAAIDKAKSFGDDVDTVANLAKKECQQKVKELEEVLKCSKKHLELCQNRLSSAKLKLKNYYH